MIELYLAKEFSHFEGAIQYKSGDFRRNLYMRLEDFADWRHANQRHGLFTTAYRYSNGEDIRTGEMIGNLYLDLDIPDIDEDDNFNKIQEDALRAISALGGIFGVPKEAVQVYFSGQKGIHIVVPAEVFGIEPHEQLNEIFREIALDMHKLSKHQTIDTGIYDRVRLFRVPNSVHPKTGLYKVRISYQELKTLTYTDIARLAESPRKPSPVNRHYIPQANRLYKDYLKDWKEKKTREAKSKKKGGERKLSFMPPCIEHLLNTPALETVGRRNDRCAMLASYYMQRGLPENEAVEEIISWSSQYCQPSLPSGEIKRTVASIYRGQRKYGCRSLKEISVCSESCRLHESRRKE